MSFPSAVGQLAALRDDAQLLLEQADDQEKQLEALVALAERDLLHATAAVSDTTVLDADQVADLLAAELERSRTAAVTAARLCLAAHLQHIAARRLLTHVTDGRGADMPCPRGVLVVDDYDDVRTVVARVLQEAGFVVRTATNGLDALLAAYEMRPAIIVMDVSMPVLDGIEATRLIKAAEATRDARVIAYTGNPTFEDSSIRTMFAAVLTKPSSPDTLLATVQHVAGL